jgi:hypothetical protein
MANTNSYYFHKQSWTIDTVPPGVKIGVVGALFIVPLLGSLFLIFLPVIGFALIGKMLFKKTIELGEAFFQTSVAPIAAPGETHFTGKHEDVYEEKIVKENQDHRVQK